jgi:hypothetical protein
VVERFKVGVHQLPPAQAGLVRALVQLLSSGSNQFPWTFSTEGPYDALIVDSHSPDIGDARLRASTHALSALGSFDQTVPAGLEVLDWPLRADRLESWLGRVQRTLGRAQPEPVRAEPVAASQARYRLKRWPPTELLRGDPRRVRLATLLTKRHLDLAELQRLSGEPADRCQVFLQLLQGFNLVDLQAGAAIPVAAPQRAMQPLPRTVIQSIRRRLGL